ncbi:hypothetical protein [Hymenobacter cheonanensis]|uniref:hypothetical protein n=1 Tax=Hymenobacter sp. CA2-7 TaxID=3063993 RepID=UPI002713CCB7|nr:hypothetical protein [Hymenobacter sp. CA2-7]MDO7888194.1 hypothetical protein [Hymenobacter sp. CA2-7]
MKKLLLAGLLAVGVASPAVGQTKGNPAERTEAQTLGRGVALRRPGEADSAFMRRVLPVSYSESGHRVVYAWRPSTFGKQLLFVVQGDNGPKTALFILDPYQPATYAVQRLGVVINGGCDLASSLDAIFFADINHDGKKELLALGFCYAQEQSEDKDDNGRIMVGHVDRQGTVVYRYAGSDGKGRPRYEKTFTPRYLTGVETAAEARAKIAAHQRHRSASPRASNKSK